jgi:CBS domain-containing protein
MTVAPRTLREEASIAGALLIMRAGRFRRLPVVNHRNELVGLVTLDDILMSLADEFTEIGRLLHRETPRAIAEDRESAHVSIF